VTLSYRVFWLLNGYWNWICINKLLCFLWIDPLLLALIDRLKSALSTSFREFVFFKLTFCSSLGTGFIRWFFSTLDTVFIKWFSNSLNTDFERRFFHHTLGPILWCAYFIKSLICIWSCKLVLFIFRCTLIRTCQEGVIVDLIQGSPHLFNFSCFVVFSQEVWIMNIDLFSILVLRDTL
jgi:hypothetical protein